MAGRPKGVENPKRRSDCEYKPEYCEQIIEHMASGLSAPAFAGKLRIHKSTLYRWAEDHPEFKEALEIGNSCERLYWEKLGRDHVVESPGKPRLNGAVYQFNMINRFDDWGMKGKNDAPDSVNQINVNVDELSPEARDARLARINELATKLKIGGKTDGT